MILEVLLSFSVIFCLICSSSIARNVLNHDCMTFEPLEMRYSDGILDSLSSGYNTSLTETVARKG